MPSLKDQCFSRQINRKQVMHNCLSCLSRAFAGYPVFCHGGRKSACRDGVDLVSRWVLRGRERGVSNTLLGDQRVRGRRDRIGLDSAARSRCCYVAARWPVLVIRRPQYSYPPAAESARPGDPKTPVAYFCMRTWWYRSLPTRSRSVLSERWPAAQAAGQPSANAFKYTALPRRQRSMAALAV